MIHGAVSQNGGRVEVYSELGHGTSFKIYLPRVTDDGLAEPGAPESPSPAGNERILHVKDDPHVRALRPGTRVLLTSGYTANVIVQHGVLKPGVEFLPKPFTTATLARRVREVLDGRPAAEGAADGPKATR